LCQAGPRSPGFLPAATCRIQAYSNTSSAETLRRKPGGAARLLCTQVRDPRLTVGDRSLRGVCGGPSTGSLQDFGGAPAVTTGACSRGTGGGLYRETHSSARGAVSSAERQAHAFRSRKRLDHASPDHSQGLSGLTLVRRAVVPPTPTGRELRAAHVMGRSHSWHAR
jgi:hypothetical protein